MKIEINKIPVDGLNIKEKITLEKTIFEKANILDMKEVYVEGIINYDYENNLVLDLKIEGIFVLEDAITLDAIERPFSCTLEETIKNLENYGQFYEKSKNILDISEILWENIVLEIPISVTNSKSEDLSLKGEGWELKNKTVSEIDPRLEKLNELFKEGKD